MPKRQSIIKCTVTEIQEACHRGGHVLAFERMRRVRVPAAQSARVFKRIPLKSREQGMPDARCTRKSEIINSTGKRHWNGSVNSFDPSLVRRVRLAQRLHPRWRVKGEANPGRAGIVEPDALYDHLHGQERCMDAIKLADAKAHLSELVEPVVDPGVLRE